MTEICHHNYASYLYTCKMSMLTCDLYKCEHVSIQDNYVKNHLFQHAVHLDIEVSVIYLGEHATYHYY